MEIASDQEIRNHMQVKFGFTDFKSAEQEASVKAVLRRDKNIIVSMASNSGKSLCFQLAGKNFEKKKNSNSESFKITQSTKFVPGSLQSHGIILVICPNLSLLENQMRYLNGHGLKTVSINSTTEPGSDERREIRDLLLDNNSPVKFFYLCPEMAAMDFYTEFINDMLRDGLISHVVVDEAHCVVDKGFRPAYEALNPFRVKHPLVPFIALTTASKEVIADIQEKLGMTKPTVIRSSSVRKDIFYEAHMLKDGETVDLNFIKALTPDFDSLKQQEIPSGIIYCSTVIEIEDTLKALKKLEIPATSFHAKISSEERFENYNDWMADNVPVMVATTESFGLGIIKQHVKFVVHVSVPKNLRAYYQVIQI